jgi:hypothetical protein
MSTTHRLAVILAADVVGRVIKIAAVHESGSGPFRMSNGDRRMSAIEGRAAIAQASRVCS